MKNFIYCFFIMVLISGCGQKPQPYSHGIVSLSPAATEILFALGSKNVIGVSDFCNYPPEAAKLPKMGGAWTPYVEKIAAARPGLVFVVQNSSAKTRLENLNIKVIEVPDPRDFDELVSNIDLIGAAVNLETAGLKAQILRGLSSVVKPAKAPRVFVVLDNGLWTAGGGSYINFLINSAGGTNIFADGGDGYKQVAWEAVVEANPDVIICLTPSVGEDFSARPLAGKINAVKTGQIYNLTRGQIDIISRPGPRTPQAVSILNKIFAKAKTDE